MKYYFWLIYDFKCRGSFFFLFFNRRCRVIYIYIYSFFRASIFFQRDRSFALRSKQKQNGDTRISNRMGIDRSRSTGDEHWETRKRCEFFFDRDTSRTCQGTVINLLNGRPVRMNPRALAFNCFEIQIPRFSSGGGEGEGRVTYENETGVGCFARCHCNYALFPPSPVSNPPFSSNFLKLFLFFLPATGPSQIMNISRDSIFHPPLSRPEITIFSPRWIIRSFEREGGGGEFNLIFASFVLSRCFLLRVYINRFNYQMRGGFRYGW